MNCPTCSHAAGKFGKTRDGQQRYRCAECRKTFSEPKPLAGLVTDVDTAAKALSMLLGVMKAPMQKLVGTLQAAPVKLVRTVVAIRDQKQAAG